MKFVSQSLGALAVLGVCAAASAQPSPASQDTWALGVGTSVIDSPYAGEGRRARVVPLLTYEGERVFVRGLTAGVHLWRAQDFTLDALVSGRLSGFDVADLGQAELRANGLDPALLSDRDDGLDLGLRATWRTPYGSLAVQALHDVSGASDGHELGIDYRYTWAFDRTAVTAYAGANWMSAKLAGYYFGTLDEEVARGATAYAPGSAVVPRLGLSVVHSLGASKWQLLGSAEYQVLPGELKDSPWLERDRDGIARVGLGVSRRF